MIATRLLALALSLTPVVASAADYPFSYHRVEVAPGIHAFIEDFGRAIVSSNIVAIVGDESVAVIDTGHHPRLTRAIAGEIRAITSKPVRYVVNTHWHNDHVSGNAVFAEAWPSATIVAHSFTAAVMDRDVRAFQGPNCAPFLRTQSQPLRDALAKGAGADGKPLTEARKKRMEAFVVDADAALVECGEFRYRGVDLTFEDRVTLKLGNRDVELLHWGRGNTAGDVVAWVPDARMLATGDLVVHPFPYATQSYISEWAAVLKRLEATPFEVMVPGHGPPMRDRKYVAEVREVMESVMAQARAAYKPGMSADELKKLVDVKALKERMAGGDAMIAANFDYMVGELAVTRAWQELAGKWEPEGLPANPG
jgi:glyoxylase-like metal-dependent hydrolase (beta-lactamase superfamily II)